MIKLRQGRKNPHTLYIQMGAEPADTDQFVGSCVTPQMATLMVDCANVGIPPIDAALRAEEPTDV